jgi:hypothetical protein
VTLSLHKLCDYFLSPFVLLAALLLRVTRRAGVERMPVARWIFKKVGVLPITTHYTDPWAEAQARRRSLDEPRSLPGVNFNVEGQLGLLKQFSWSDELRALPLDGPTGSFHYRNGTFGAGDAEVLYSLIRLKRPKNIVEIGGGNSTLVIAAAIAANRADGESSGCRHVCIEPFESPWLEATGVEIVRRRLEEVEYGVFENLGRDDILFIDSSHVIRPQGDVLTLYLDIIPRIAPGVLVHVHDVFTPRDYPSRWLDDAMLLWNEQYLLEAFLSSNDSFRVVAALNMLFHDHRHELNAACPVLATEGGPAPGSFWMARN